MRFLNRKLWRDIARAKGQYIAITAVVLLGVALYTGMMSAAGSVGRDIDDFYGSQHLADLWIHLPAATPDLVAQVRALPGVAAADARTTTTATAGTHEFTVATIGADPTVNVPALDVGQYPSATDDALVDRGYAAANGLGVGNTVAVTIGSTPRTLTIVGIANSPEYLYLAKDLSAQPDHHTYGALWVTPALLAPQPDNEIDVVATPGTDLARLKVSLAATALPDGVGVITGRDQLLSWVMVNNDVTQYGQIGAIFPILFFLVAAAIIAISMSKNVDTQRDQIGNLKALGIRRSAITAHYLSYTVVTCVIGAVLGVVLGVVAVMPGIEALFTTFYTMPALHPSGFVGNALVATGVALVFGLAATALAVRRPLSETPAAAMRPRVPRQARPLLLERTPVWSRLTYSTKIILRNLFLHKGRVALSSIGVIGCVGLLLASFGFLDSIRSVLGPQFYAMSHYDVAVTLAAPAAPNDPFPATLTGVKAAVPEGSVPASFTGGGTAVSTNLLALPEGSTAIALADAAGDPIAWPTTGVVVPKLLADRYHLAVGASLALTLTPVQGSPQPITVSIAAIGVEYIEQDLYTTPTYLATLGVTLPISTYYLQLDDPSTAATVASHLAANPAVAQALTLTQLANAWSQDLSLMGSLVYVMIAVSAVLSLTVVYNISAINIVERRRDIATLKVLGYHRREVNRLIFRENLAITALGAVIGLPVGVGMLELLLQAAVSGTMLVPLVISGWSVLIAVALGFAFTVLANQLLRGRITRIDMVESLKSVE